MSIVRACSIFLIFSICCFEAGATARNFGQIAIVDDVNVNGATLELFYKDGHFYTHSSCTSDVIFKAVAYRNSNTTGDDDWLTCAIVTTTGEYASSLDFSGVNEIINLRTLGCAMKSVNNGISYLSYTEANMGFGTNASFKAYKPNGNTGRGTYIMIKNVILHFMSPYTVTQEGDLVWGYYGDNLMWGGTAPSYTNPDVYNLSKINKIWAIDGWYHCVFSSPAAANLPYFHSNIPCDRVKFTYKRASTCTGSMIVHKRWANDMNLTIADGITIDNNTTEDYAALEVTSDDAAYPTMLWLRGDVVVTNSMSGSGTENYKGVGVKVTGGCAFKVSDHPHIEKCKIAIDERSGMTNFAEPTSSSSLYDLNDNNISVNLYPGAYISKGGLGVSNLPAGSIHLHFANPSGWLPGAPFFMSYMEASPSGGTYDCKIVESDRDLFTIDNFAELDRYYSFDLDRNPNGQIQYPMFRLSQACVYNNNTGKWYSKISSALMDTYPVIDHPKAKSGRIGTAPMQDSDFLLVLADTEEKDPITVNYDNITIQATTGTIDGITGKSGGSTVKWTMLESAATTRYSCIYVPIGKTINFAGNGVPLTLSFDNSYNYSSRILRVLGGANLNLGAKVSGGYLDTELEQSGGGICVGEKINKSGSDTDVSNFVFGAVECDGAEIYGNSAVNGGGVFVIGGTFHCKNTVIRNNVVKESAGYDPAGGGIFVGVQGTCILDSGTEIRNNTNNKFTWAKGIYQGGRLKIKESLRFGTEDDIFLPCLRISDSGVEKIKVIEKAGSFSVSSAIPLSIGDLESEHAYNGRNLVESAEANVVSEDLTKFSLTTKAINLEAVNKSRPSDLMFLYTAVDATTSNPVLELVEDQTKYDFKISKSGMAAGETCIISAQKDGGSQEYTIMLKADSSGNASATIKRADTSGSSLYHVYENNLWTWNYNPTLSQSHDIRIGNYQTYTFNFTNSKNVSKQNIKSAEEGVNNRFQGTESLIRSDGNGWF